MKNIAIYCSANNGNNPQFIADTKKLAKALVARNIGVVYGGATVGLMGVIADEVLALGGEVTGVLPQMLMDRELAHNGLTHLEIVSTMEERRTRMIALSDGFIALPGGFGTMDEIFEVITLAQLDYHQKPCGFLNSASYYDKLIDFIEHAESEGLVQKSSRDKVIFEQDVDILLDRFLKHK